MKKIQKAQEAQESALDPASRGQSRRTVREERQARALRDNLRRRKKQAREWASASEVARVTELEDSPEQPE